LIWSSFSFFSFAILASSSLLNITGTPGGGGSRPLDLDDILVLLDTDDFVSSNLEALVGTFPPTGLGGLAYDCTFD
jgi:hypothetical protein